MVSAATLKATKAAAISDNSTVVKLIGISFVSKLWLANLPVFISDSSIS